MLNKTFVSDRREFPDIYLSQGSVATRLGCGGIFNDHLILIISLLLSPTVKEFRKSVNIGEVMDKSSVLVFFTHDAVDTLRSYVIRQQPPNRHRFNSTHYN